MSNNIKTTKIQYWETVVIPPHVKDVWDELASQEDTEVYAVGGVVRDLLMKRQPHDWDLTTNATPSRIRSIFGARNVIQEENNKKFGVTFVRSNNQTVEVSTFREDISVGRKPDVRFSLSYVTDAWRRDFTINSLYLDMQGIVHDPTGLGTSHLKKNKLEFVGKADDRITQDPLRLLRGIRFMAMGFKPTGSTKTALMNNTKHLALLKKTIPIERVQTELLKMMATNLRQVIPDLVNSGIMKMYIPEFMDTVGFDQKSDYHMFKLDKHLIETATELQRLFNDNDEKVDKEQQTLILIGLLHDIAKPSSQEVGENGQARYIGHDTKGAEIIEAIFTRLKFSNKSTRKAKVLVENHMVLHQQHNLKVLLRLTNTISQANLSMRDVLWLYKADLYASRKERSYLPDGYEFPSIKATIESSEIMDLLLDTFGVDYDKKLIGKVLKRMREFYYEFPNIATFKLRVKIKDYIRSLN